MLFAVLSLLTITCLSLALSCVAQIPGPPPAMPRSQTYQGRDTSGTYSFGYTVHEPTGTTKFRQESGDGAGNRQGSYGLEEKDSQRIVFNYATKPKSSIHYINHPLSSHQHDHQGLSPPSPLITPSQSTVSDGSSGRGGPIEGSSVDGFSPSFEPRGQDMEDESRFNNPSFDDDFDFDGRGKVFGGEPKMRQASNTHWDGGDSGGMDGGSSGNGGYGGHGVRGEHGGHGGHGPWNRQLVNGEHNGHHHPHHAPHHAHPHQPNAEPDHHSHHQRGPQEEYGMNESSDLTNEPANYDRLVAYLNNQRPNGPPPSPPHSRPPMRPEEFGYQSR